MITKFDNFLNEEMMDDNLSEIKDEAREKSKKTKEPVYISHLGFGVYAITEYDNETTDFAYQDGKFFEYKEFYKLKT